MSVTLDPKEVLYYLNELGYYNITTEQLKEFMTGKNQMTFKTVHNQTLPIFRFKKINIIRLKKGRKRKPTRHQTKNDDSSRILPTKTLASTEIERTRKRSNQKSQI